MAPAKRRAGKASACQKWSLGDLVLAKVKGFPAWPAKISKPEDWHQTHDPRKVFVYFFGTKEIGFCAPTDIQAFTVESKNKLLARCRGKTVSDFTRAVREICDEYDELEMEKQDVIPEIHKMKSRSCVDSSNDSVEKIHFKDVKMQSPTHDSEEVLKVQQNDHIQKHRETAVKKNELNIGLHRQADSQKKQISMGAGESKEKAASLIKMSVKKEDKLCNEVLVGVKKQNSVVTLKANHMRSHAKGEKATNHSDHCSKNDLSCAASTVGESEIKKIMTGFKGSLESKSYGYDHGEDMTVNRPVLRENGNLQVSGIKGNTKVEQDFENIHASPVLSDTKHVLCPFVNKEDEEKAVPDNVSQHNSILKKKRNLLKKHNPGASVLMKSSANAGVDHRKKRTQLLKGRKHKLKFDGTQPLPKRARTHSEDGASIMTEGLHRKNIMGATNNVGKNTTVDNEMFSHHVQFKSNDRMGSNSPPIERNFLHGEKSLHLLGMATCLPPKADKYRLRSSLQGDEAALPPSKRRHRAQEAMSACVAEAATALMDPVTTGSDAQDDALGIYSNENPYTECCENEGKLVQGSEGCIKGSHSSFPVEVIGTVIKKSVMCPDLHQLHGSLPSEPSSCVEKMQVNSMFEDSFIHAQRDKWQTVDNVDMNVQAKISDRLSLPSRKMEEWKDNGTIASILSSPKKQDSSEFTLRRGNSPHYSPIKVHGAVKVDAGQYEYKCKSTKVKKSAIHKNEQNSPIRSAIEPTVDKIAGPSKSNFKINGAVTFKSERVSYCAELHLEKGSKLKDTHEAAKEVKIMSKDSDIAVSSTSMKHLIAAAQAKREQARSVTMPQSVANDETANSIPVFMSSPSPFRETSSHRSSPLQFHSGSMPHEDTKNAFARVESGSPRGNGQQWVTTDAMDLGLSEERKNSSERKSIGGILSGDTEAAVARDTFEGMLETLSRTKESIGRASRHAIDCAKYRIASEIVELLVQKLENELSFHRRIDLFFLVDSITQCSHSQKGVAGASYIPAVQGALPRLLAAAAPSGSVARENRRQCLKVLRLWLERKILPEPILRQYMIDIGSSNDDRAVGINATFHLPGFSMSNVFEDEEELCASDWKKSDDELVVEPTEAQEDQTKSSTDPMERHRHILEDVDGELEMEDVSPTSEYDPSSSKDYIIQPISQDIPHCSLPLDHSNPCPPLPLGSPPLPEDPPPFSSTLASITPSAAS
ncbi:hypothetical protein KI387_018348 [Taxus chinensis]|uniref:ENHANCER OF AG-4 protein 2 n=1 Tax=Taxus chinensis TaxID=29808 RepID=A0AA38GHH5_TAXCH|nr:hypothetical protein KI387_018348 [Taxus chinensis]